MPDPADADLLAIIADFEAIYHMAPRTAEIAERTGDRNPWRTARKLRALAAARLVVRHGVKRMYTWSLATKERV